MIKRAAWFWGIPVATAHQKNLPRADFIAAASVIYSRLEETVEHSLRNAENISTSDHVSDLGLCSDDRRYRVIMIRCRTGCASVNRGLTAELWRSLARAPQWPINGFVWWLPPEDEAPRSGLYHKSSKARVFIVDDQQRSTALAGGAGIRPTCYPSVAGR